MPRVVSNQRAKFQNDDIFRRLSRECEVRYTGFRDRPPDERQLRFQTECREGHADIAFVATGTNLQLQFSANAWSDRPEDRIPTREFVNFDREPGKVHLKSQFILNGVCVIWRGWIDLHRLDGIGCLDFDEERAEAEDALLREQIEAYNRRLREFEDRQRQYQQQQQQRQAEAECCSFGQTLELALSDGESSLTPVMGPTSVDVLAAEWSEGRTVVTQDSATRHQGQLHTSSCPYNCSPQGLSIRGKL
ncbi:core-binding factor subunit beta-like isoform X1 [Babylonia areolata]|uniref:core-binding factor subunit beta-like isoform X1 n=1 Tax=Babylonia areolata TaxID=304850 RepID=UPI003FD17A86